jgi:hypothetical protein
VIRTMVSVGATLVRLPFAAQLPRLGILTIENEKFCTLELPYRNNQNRVSCIPPGTYECDRAIDRYTSGGLHIPQTYEVTHVPSRAGVLIHVGNTVRDTHGCILLGEEFGILNGDLALLESRKAFARFLGLADGAETITLSITD